MQYVLYELLYFALVAHNIASVSVCACAYAGACACVWHGVKELCAIMLQLEIKNDSI